MSLEYLRAICLDCSRKKLVIRSALIYADIKLRWQKICYSTVNIEKDFRGKHLHILIENPNKRETGYEKLILNGTELDSSKRQVHFL